MTWEYLVRNLQGSDKAQEQKMNELGAQGWELVHLSFNNKVGYFKRGIPTVQGYHNRDTEIGTGGF